MKRGAAIAAAFSLSACAQASPPPPRAALQAVLAYEAAQPRERTPVCVATRTDGITFDEERWQLRTMRQSRPTDPREEAMRQRILAAFEHPSFDWRVAPPPGHMGPRLPSELDRAQSESLSAAARPFAATGQPAAPPLDLGPIPAPLRAGITSDCAAQLTLTAPVGTRDLLFVQSSYSCGALCGVGWVYALRAEDGEWRIVAIAWAWSS